MSMELWWYDTDRGNPKYSEKNVSECQSVHHKPPYGLTRSFVVRGQWLTAWAMARPHTVQYSAHFLAKLYIPVAYAEICKTTMKQIVDWDRWGVDNCCILLSPYFQMLTFAFHLKACLSFGPVMLTDWRNMGLWKCEITETFISL
jgi:hypothetical protein